MTLDYHVGDTRELIKEIPDESVDLSNLVTPMQTVVVQAATTVPEDLVKASQSGVLIVVGTRLTLVATRWVEIDLAATIRVVAVGLWASRCV